VEYHNDRKDVIVNKTLSEKELERFFNHPSGFDPQWHYTALQMFTFNTQFNLLRYKKADGKGTTVYSINEGLRPIGTNSNRYDISE